MENISKEWVETVAGELLVPLLDALSAFERVQEQWHPPRVPELAAWLAPFAEELRAARSRFRDVEPPPSVATSHQRLDEAAHQALLACDRFIKGPADQRALGALLSSTRCYGRACEALYPLCGELAPIDRFLVEEPLRDTHRPPPHSDHHQDDLPRGILHGANGRDSRGAYSLFAPEIVKPHYPLVIALHGGGGHGADFLWTWLRAARGRGFILASLTSRQNTWSLREPDTDLAPLLRMVQEIRERYPVDPEHIMVSGWSDGGTYALMSGVTHTSPFTHIASCSGSLHPRVVSGEDLARTQGKPIYMVHGTQDYMFPIENARRARVILTRVGADLTFQEVDHLSHNWAPRECSEILSWFDPTLELPGATP